MSNDTQASPVRRSGRRRVKTVPVESVETKRCAKCRQPLPLDLFSARQRGGQGVAANCKECVERHYQSGTFRCNRCNRSLSGPDFSHGSAGAAIQQPCKECYSAAKKTATRLRQIERGRTPYHLLSEIDTEARTATCRECGPVHVYATGAKGCGWRCGRRSDELSKEWYDTKAQITDKHVSKRWHYISDVRGVEMRGTCSQCGDAPVRWRQAESRFVCASPERKRRHADNERRRRRLALYGLTADDYDRMNEEQGGRCAICGGGGNRVRSDSDGSLVIDHDHATGAVRALLCSLCNSGLGHFSDDPALLLAAIEYLKAHAQPKVRAA